VAYGGYTAATTAGGGALTVVNHLTGGGTMAANLSSYALRIVNSGNSDILDLNTRRLLLSNNSTLLYAGGSDNQYTITGTTGFINSNSLNQPFIINTFAGTTLTVNAQLGQNFAGFAKAGEGTLVVGGANAKLASTKYIQQGVLRLTDAGGLGTDYTRAQAAVVQGGAALELSNNIAVGAQALSLNGAGISNGGALRNKSGTNSFAGLITTGASGARINADASSSLTLTGGIATTLTQDVTFGGAGNTTVSTAAISGGGSVNKDGAGTITLSADNTYTGATNVSAGSLIINGAISSTSAVTVGTNGTLGGGGTIGGSVTLNDGAFLSPGDSTTPANSLMLGSSLTLNADAILAFGLGTDSDLISFSSVADNLIGSGNATLQLSLLSGFSYANTYTIFQNTSTSGFTLLAITGYDDANYTANFFESGDNYQLNFTPVPEPGAALLGGLGLLALLRRRRG
jgi:autotransporter-associated beta strand protein